MRVSPVSSEPCAARPRGLLPPRLPEPAFCGEELAVITEFPGAVGHLLWCTVHDLNLWAESEGEPGLFASGAAERRRAEWEAVREQLGEAAEPLWALGVLLELPDLVSARALRMAAWRVSEWAEQRGALATALAFACAALRADPDAQGSGALAMRAGELFRERGRHALSEQWFRWAIAMARRAGDHGLQAWACAGLANVFLERGNGAQARTSYARFLRLARRHSLHAREPARRIAEGLRRRAG